MTKRWSFNHYLEAEIVNKTCMEHNEHEVLPLSKFLTNACFACTCLSAKAVRFSIPKHIETPCGRENVNTMLKLYISVATVKLFEQRFK